MHHELMTKKKKEVKEKSLCYEQKKRIPTTAISAPQKKKHKQLISEYIFKHASTYIFFSLDFILAPR